MIENDLLDRTFEAAANAGCPVRWAAWNLFNPNTEEGCKAHIQFYQWWLDPFQFTFPRIQGAGTRPDREG